MELKNEPMWKLISAGEETIFAVTDLASLQNYFKVSFVLDIYVGLEMNPFATGTKVATLQVTPNGAGTGIFDVRPIISNYVSPDYTGGHVDGAAGSSFYSSYRTIPFSIYDAHPIHCIDKFSTSRNSVRYMAFHFNIMRSVTPSGTPVLGSVSGVPWFNGNILVYNGYLKETDVLQNDLYATGTLIQYGYNLDNQGQVIMRNIDAKFLTNAPVQQYVRLGEYGTLSFFSQMDGAIFTFTVGTPSATQPSVNRIKVVMFNAGGSGLVTFYVDCNNAAGGDSTFTLRAEHRIQYVGCAPANFQWSAAWLTNEANCAYYIITAEDDVPTQISKEYRFDIIDSDCKGYEPIRLTWLNKYGTWDYYTFNKKSIRSTSTKRSEYQQLKGTWNEAMFLRHGYQGGKKNFRVNSKETITINTDYMNEEDAIWFEELINSPEVYILNSGLKPRYYMTNALVEPVLLKTSNFIRKTKANDKLIQYTFVIERNTFNQTQSV